MHEEPLISVLATLDRASTHAPFESYACTLSTVSGNARPAGRIIHVRVVDERGFVFFSNRESSAGRHIMEIPQAALCFFWPWIGEQMRVQGRIELVADDVSDEFFESLPRDRKLTAWASLQSHPLSSRGELMQRYRETKERYEGRDVPRPPYWGGYRMVPDRIEFWKAGESDLHERVLWMRGPDGWRGEMLFP